MPELASGHSGERCSSSHTLLVSGVLAARKEGSSAQQEPTRGSKEPSCAGANGPEATVSTFLTAIEGTAKGLGEPEVVLVSVALALPVAVSACMSFSFSVSTLSPAIICAPTPIAGSVAGTVSCSGLCSVSCTDRRVGTAAVSLSLCGRFGIQ